MKKVGFLRFVTVLSVFSMIVSQAFIPCFAVSTEDAKEPIDPNRECSFRLIYLQDSKPCEGLEIELYRVASVTEDYQYSLVGQFSDESINVNGIKAQSEWKTVAETVGAYVVANQISPTDQAATDSNGLVEFKNQQVGLYFVRWTGNPVPGNVSGFDSFMVSLPGQNVDGTWDYDLEAYPKSGGNTFEVSETYLQVIKQWRDYSDKKRPASVEITIFRDGTLYETVILSPDNNWTYTWKTENKHKWNVIERKVPDRYTVTIEQKGTKFIVTNTTTDAPPPSPKTGDRTPLELYVAVLTLAGFTLSVIGFVWKRRVNE